MTEKASDVVDKVHRRSTELVEVREYGLRKFGNEVSPAKMNDRGWGEGSSSEIEGPNQDIWFPPMKQKIHVPTRGKKEKQKAQQQAKKNQQKKSTKKRKKLPVKKATDRTNRPLF